MPKFDEFTHILPEKCIDDMTFLAYIMVMKIIKVVDTRSYEEGPDDKWYPIPGSGEINICSRCSKGHEIHVTVEHEGKTSIVGLGCAKKDNLISETQHKGITSAAISLAKNKAKLEKLLKNQKIQEEIKNKVDKIPLPNIQKGIEATSKVPGENFGKVYAEIWRMDDSEVYLPQFMSKTKENFQERENCLISSWRSKRFKEIADNIPGFFGVADYLIKDCEIRIKKLEKKIAKLMEG